MYIKWIVCDVKTNCEKQFSFAQEKWIGIRGTKGLIGQIGGWDSKHENTACVISFWKNKDSLKAFMQDVHDEIFLKNNQADYYNAIQVDYFNSLLSMKGASDTLLHAMNNAKLIRIADCLVKQENTDHFELVQKEIWLPGMENSKGMLGGKFSKSANDTSRYLVSTFWDSSENHHNYTEISLPRLKVAAGVQNDVSKIIGRQITLVDAWKVINDDSQL